MNTKDAVIEMIRTMPDGVTWAEIVAEGAARFGQPGEPDENLTQEEWEEVWVDEINRRVEDIRAGRVKMIPGDEVFRRLDEKLRQAVQDRI